MQRVSRQSAVYWALLAASFGVALAASWTFGAQIDNDAYDWMSRLYQPPAWQPESALLAIVGIVAGTIISFVARRIILMELPTQRLFWSNEWVLRATAIALAGALLGALYPAFKAAQKDPIDALAYE